MKVEVLEPAALISIWMLLRLLPVNLSKSTLQDPLTPPAVSANSANSERLGAFINQQRVERQVRKCSTTFPVSSLMRNNMGLGERVRSVICR